MQPPKLEDRNVARRRTTRRISRVLLGLIAVLVAGFFWQLFGPNPPIRVSRATTYITEPLGADGLPDYRRYLIEKMSEGVTPEKNGAVQFWRAVWPGSLDPADQQLIADALGVRHPLRQGERLTALESSSASEEDLKRSVQQPWTEADSPTLAKWIDDQSTALDLIVEASRMPEWWSPSPSVLADKNDAMVGWHLPLPGYARMACRGLICRSWLRLGRDDPEGAWKDCQAVYRIAGQLHKDWFLVSHVAGDAVVGDANHVAAAVLSHRHPPALSLAVGEELRRVAALLATRGPSLQGERCMMLDSLLFLAGHRNARDGEYTGQSKLSDQIATVCTVDYNVSLVAINQEMDAAESALMEPTWKDRIAALSQLDQRIELAYKSRTLNYPATLSLPIRSRTVSAIFNALMFPGLIWSSERLAYTETVSLLVGTAAQLVTVRGAADAFPDALIPALRTVPEDVLTGSPLVYRRTDDGFLLYSVGLNGVDDGGSNDGERMGPAMFEGRPMEYWMAIEPLGDPEATEQDHPRFKQIPPGADDISLRFPVWHATWPGNAGP